MKWLNDEHTGLREYPDYRRGLTSEPSISRARRWVRRVWAGVGRVLAAVFANETPEA